ncbi:sensor histidine kinase [Emcibacter sp.]|uniref:sensor histidine kinase n=1 Tax=Emcibacter sp. TaxID=1979954 RepID=UPI002AA60445|nr:ATP-binding protein [Emcibacter sp.]
MHGKSEFYHDAGDDSLTGAPTSQTIVPLETLEKLRRGKQSEGKKGVSSRLLAQVRTLIDRMNIDDAVPLYVASVEGELVYVNDRYRELVSTCSVSGRGNNQTENRTLPSSLVAILNEVQLTRQTMVSEEQILVQKEVRYYRSRHFPICDDQGYVIAVGGTYVDCTQQKKQERNENLMQQRFRDFARATSDWYWEVDRDYRITFVSERLTSLTGLPAFMMNGKRFEQIGTLKKDIDGEEIICDDFLDLYKPFRDYLLVIEDQDGEEVYIHLSGVPLFDSETGAFQGYRGAGMDVTVNYRARMETLAVQKSLENTLEELTNKNIQLDMASAEAEASLNAKSEFLAAMSHELRTPLNAIIGFAEAMNLEVFGDLNPQYVSYSTDIMNAGKHLLELINDVLDVAVLESGKLSLELTPTSLADIIVKALNLTILRANSKYLDTSNVKITQDYTVNVDERRATQIFVNLLSNAVKFTPEYGEIGIQVKKLDRNHVAVTVWDTGIGIPQNQQDLVFEKFHQATDNIYSRKEEGTGLGLHISRHLAQQMGGDIRLYSVVNEGSEFTVILPIAQTD